MLWYLANGSLNSYIKSQIELQGHYYSDQKTTLVQADYSENNQRVILNQLALTNIESLQAPLVLSIDDVSITFGAEQQQTLVTEVSQITIEKLIINIERINDNITNIEQLINTISLKLAEQHPQYYPEISAKFYAQNHPELDAVLYAKDHPQAGPIIEQSQPKKSRDKDQPRFIISQLLVKQLQINTLKSETTFSKHRYDLKITTIGENKTGEKKALALNQVGGEILLALLKLAKQ